MNTNKIKKLEKQIIEDEFKLDVNFLKWFALNSNMTKGEYGERKEIGLYDPEAEIQRIAGLIDEASEPIKDEPDK